MKHMPLSQAYLREIFDYNPMTGLLIRRVSLGSRAQAGDVVGTPAGSGYLNVCINYKKYLVHRLIWMYVHGVWPSIEVDHWNRRKADNWLSNLRLATHSENQHNIGIRRNNSSGFTGVKQSSSAGKWCARITLDGREISLGTYDTPELASDAYQAAKLIHHPTAPQQ